MLCERHRPRYLGKGTATLHWEHRQRQRCRSSEIGKGRCAQFEAFGVERMKSVWLLLRAVVGDQNPAEAQGLLKGNVDLDLARISQSVRGIDSGPQPKNARH